MPTININHSSPFTARETFNKAKALLSQGEGLKKFDSHIQYQFDDSTMSGELNGRQFKARLNVTESGDKAHVSIVIDIPFPLIPFKGQIQASIEEKLNQLLDRA